MPPEEPPTGEQPDPTFADLGLPPLVLQALDSAGYESPSPIQSASIPPLLAGRDLVGLAQTGTGKTAAFALPILSRLDLSAKTPQALVLAPTRELALQVAEAFERYAAHLGNLHILPIYGGQAYGVQLAALRRGVHVVVGTPGRIMDHLDRGRLDLSEIRYLVLDEADEMLKMGFADDVESILSKTPGDKQVALFSATMPKPIRRLAEKYLDDPVEIVVKNKTATAENIEQTYLMVSHPQKVDALTRILEVETFEGMIVFVRTKQSTEQLAERLRARGFSAAAINGDIAQAVRERTVAQLKEGDLDILVATDVAARGLDVERVSHVVNFDLPTDTGAYVHRIGRTGRAGRSGQSIAFVTPRERHLLRAIEKATRHKVAERSLPSVEDVNSTRLSRFDDAITAALESDRVAFFRDVVSHYVREYDVPDVDVAAALAVVLQGDEPLLLEDEPVRSRRGRDDDRGPRRDDDRRGPRRDDRGRDDRGPRRDDRGPRRDDRGQRRLPEGMAHWRLAVGHRQRVQPGQIVAALVNEGGLTREEIGRIDIHAEYSLVELPERLPPGSQDALREAWVAGRSLGLRRYREDPPGGRRGGREDRGYGDRRGGYRDNRSGEGRSDDRRDRGRRTGDQDRPWANPFEDPRGE